MNFLVRIAQLLLAMAGGSFLIWQGAPTGVVYFLGVFLFPYSCTLAAIRLLDWIALSSNKRTNKRRADFASTWK